MRMLEFDASLGRPASLAVLDYGLFRVNAGRDVGIVGFLIETDKNKRILVDTGFPAKYADDFIAATAEDALGGFGHVLKLGHENLPAGQLARLGLRPADVDLLVMTHTHIDHVGGLADFPRAPIIIGAPERALPRPLYWGEAQPMTWPDRDYRLVERDTELLPGITVLFAPGHAPGQLSLLVELPETGPMLLTSDAISRPAEIDEGFGGSWDVEEAKRSGARLMRLAKERGAFVIFGHGPEQWPTLRKAPDTYH